VTVIKWMFWIVPMLELAGEHMDSKQSRFKCNRRSSAILFATARSRQCSWRRVT